MPDLDLDDVPPTWNNRYLYMYGIVQSGPESMRALFEGWYSYSSKKWLDHSEWGNSLGGLDHQIELGVLMLAFSDMDREAIAARIRKLRRVRDRLSGSRSTLLSVLEAYAAVPIRVSWARLPLKLG
jgi:hypothetical protein